MDSESPARRRRRLGLLAGIATALCSAPAAAIVTNPLPRVCNEYPDSDYVFSGKVLSDTYRWHEYHGGSASEIYRIRVDEVFKGKLPRVVPLYTGVDSGRGVLTVGQRAIVFAERFDGRIFFNGSSNSQTGAGAPNIIAQIRAFRANPPKVATISGRIDTWVHGPMAPLGGARLLLSDGATRRFVRADRQGRFFAAVAPGRWSVRIAEPGWASRTGVYSYDSAEKLVLRKGDCADLQIETTAPGEKLIGLPAWQRWPRPAR